MRVEEVQMGVRRKPAETWSRDGVYALVLSRRSDRETSGKKEERVILGCRDGAN